MNKISVCIATYNGEKYINEQLKSILSQLKVNDEIIISDDNSTDNTLEVIRKINDPRIFTYLNTLENGYSKNFENAMSKANGNYIFLSDQDDVWMPYKVKKMLDYLKDYDLVVSDATITDEKLNPIKDSHFKLHNTKEGFLNNWIKTRYIGACMAFNSRLLEKALPFPENQKLCAHDYWIANVAELFFKVKLINEPLIKYRRHGNNASNGGEKSKNSLKHKISVRLYTLVNLFKRKWQ